MADENTISALDISASALLAQRTRMRVIADNIANAHSIITPDGGPYRRREITFETVMQKAVTSGQAADEVAGVKVASIEASKAPLKTIYDPQHPMADEKGFVQMPNVNVTREMVDMVDAQRAYEANLAAMKTYRDMQRSSIGLLQR